MPANLLALCGAPGDATVKRIRTSADVQGRVEGFFEALEIGFRHGVEIERPYDSRWVPGTEELATLPVNAEVNAVLAAVAGGILALEEIDGENFDQEQIRALFIHRAAPGGPQLLLQTFSLNQRLAQKFAVISNGNTFNKIEDSAFTIANSIDAIVEGGLIKFKSFFNAKRIFDLSLHYKEASDEDIRQLSNSAILDVDADQLIAIATQPIRKIISSVQASGVLDNHTADEIGQKALGLVPVNVQNGKIIVPLTKRELKDLISFLDHKIYRSPVDDDPYETNSHRRRN